MLCLIDVQRSDPFRKNTLSILKDAVQAQGKSVGWFSYYPEVDARKCWAMREGTMYSTKEESLVLLYVLVFVDLFPSLVLVEVLSFRILS